MIELSRLLKLLKKVKQAGFPINDTIDEPILGNLLNRLPDMAGYTTAESRWAAASVILPYEGAVLTDELLTSFVCRFVSFRAQIKSGICPSLWKGNKAHAVMYCKGIEKVQAKKPSLKLHLLCLLGEPAGLSFEVTLSRLYLEYVLGKQLGLSFRVYNSPAEYISGSYFQCFVEEDTTGTRVTDITATETIKKLNKEKMEGRLAPLKCKTPQLECCMCPKKRKECILAVWK